MTTSVHLDDDGTTAVLVLSGAIDLTCADEVAASGHLLLTARPCPSELVVDLGDVSFVDSSGLSALVRLRRDASDRGVALRLDAVPHRVAVLLQLAGLDQVFATG